ncbi:BrnT family toxin [Anaeromyxobacter paludicola]|uniref:BrnT family toxin n=1 Tax=Anaeromyxobacter paludicola TaxID=2918171 RepID=UPI00384E3004
MNFAWDARKAVSNRRKHGVSFEEAATVFADVLALHIEDLVDPQRTLLLGLSTRGRLLLVVHAALDESTVRIISARRATSHERRRYEEEGP